MLGHEPTFVTAMARDALANFALGQLSQIGLSQSDNRLQVSWWRDIDEMASFGATATHNGAQTSTCFALVLIDSISGQCQYVIANLDAIKAITSDTIAASSKLIASAPLLVMDANLIDETMQCLIELCRKHRVPIFIEPTDLSVLPRLVDCLKSTRDDGSVSGEPTGHLSGKQAAEHNPFNPLLCMSPNAIELEGMVALFEGRRSNRIVEEEKEQDTTYSGEPLPLDQIELMANRLMRNHLVSLKCLLVTLDKRGVLVAVRSEADCIEDVRLMEEIRAKSATASADTPLLVKHFAPKQLITKPISASGAGDSFAAGFVSGLLGNLRLGDCLNLGFDAALLALQDRDTVPSSLKRLAKIKI